MNGWSQQKIGPGSFIVFQRLVRFYKTFLILSGLISALSASALQFQEFHPSTTGALRTAEGFFVSSATTAVISAMIATMLLFRFEGHGEATMKDLVLAWSPLVILDWSILAFLIGLVAWYGNQNPNYQSALVAISTGLLLLFTSWVSVDMYITMKQPGGLGAAELKFLRAQEAEFEESRVGNEDPGSVKLGAARSSAAEISAITRERT